MKNKFGYLGLIGLLGILGIITDNRAFLGFFGFFINFKYFTVIPDELFRENIRRSATPAFFISIFIMSITVALSAVIKNAMYLATGLLVDFAITLFVFTIILTRYEIKENESE